MAESNDEHECHQLDLEFDVRSGFFSIANASRAHWVATAAVSIPSGIGSIPEYYGDENAGTATISAKLTATQAAYGSAP